jgi:hypothetical protein
MHEVEMNEHQHRLWLSMLEMIESYWKGVKSFPQLVGNLEGALDAGEFRDQALVEQFYNFWQPLEITNAVRGNEVAYEEVARDVEAMQNFLLEHLITEQLRKS